jgi:hypothetical protein
LSKKLFASKVERGKRLRNGWRMNVRCAENGLETELMGMRKEAQHNKAVFSLSAPLALIEN